MQRGAINKEMDEKKSDKVLSFSDNIYLLAERIGEFKKAYREAKEQGDIVKMQIAKDFLSKTTSELNNFIQEIGTVNILGKLGTTPIQELAEKNKHEAVEYLLYTCGASILCAANGYAKVGNFERVDELLKIDKHVSTRRIIISRYLQYGHFEQANKLLPTEENIETKYTIGGDHCSILEGYARGNHIKKLNGYFATLPKAAKPLAMRSIIKDFATVGNHKEVTDLLDFYKKVPKLKLQLCALVGYTQAHDEEHVKKILDNLSEEKHNASLYRRAIAMAREMSALCYPEAMPHLHERARNAHMQTDHHTYLTWQLNYAMGGHINVGQYASRISSLAERLLPAVAQRDLIPILKGHILHFILYGSYTWAVLNISLIKFISKRSSESSPILSFITLKTEYIKIQEIFSDKRNAIHSLVFLPSDELRTLFAEELAKINAFTFNVTTLLRQAKTVINHMKNYHLGFDQAYAWALADETYTHSISPLHVWLLQAANCHWLPENAMHHIASFLHPYLTPRSAAELYQNIPFPKRTVKDPLLKQKAELLKQHDFKPVMTASAMPTIHSVPIHTIAVTSPSVTKLGLYARSKSEPSNLGSISRSPDGQRKQKSTTII